MLFFMDEVIDETQMMRQQMNMGNPMGSPDPQKAFEAEKQAFDLVSHLESLSISKPFDSQVMKPTTINISMNDAKVHTHLQYSTNIPFMMCSVPSPI